MQRDLTVADLVADPALDTRLLSGAAGLDRTVRWAQTSEMLEPWAWLGPDELLMTVGLGLPADPAAQADFVRSLDGAGLAGMLLGEDGLAPPVTDEMRRACDDLGFPLLATGRTPFVVIARTVSAATTGPQSRSVLLLSRLYQAAGRQDAVAKRSGRWIAELCGAEVAVVDDLTGCALVGDATLLDRPNRALALPTVRPTRLVLPAASEIEAMTLVHLTQILTVDANTILQEAAGDVAAGEAELAAAFDGRLDLSDLDAAWGAADGRFRTVAVPVAEHARFASALALTGIRPLVAGRRDVAVAVVPADELPRVRDLAATLGVRAGVSPEHATGADLAGSAVEARSALEHAGADATWSEFVGLEVSLLARSRSEAESIVAAVLGPLADDEADAALRTSLFTLLDHDLQWKQAADELGIHRQTLAYRLRRVEERTGRSVRRVKDLSELWLARTAWRMLGRG